MQVQEIMRPNVHMADPNMTIREAARRMRANNIGALPVGDNDRRAAASREYYRGLRGAAQSREHADRLAYRPFDRGRYDGTPRRKPAFAALARTAKQEPRPISERTSRACPSWSAMCLTTNSPSPRPSARVESIR